MELFALKLVIIVNERRYPMFTIFALFIASLLVIIAGADIFLSEFNADELSIMGVERQ
jgi:hypothetical protein